MTIRELGYAVLAFSATLGFLAYFALGLRPLAYSMIGLAVVGLTAIAIGNSPRPEPAAERLILESLAINIEALLEETEAAGRAIFTPTRDGLVRAFVPISDIGDPVLVAKALLEAPLRVSSVAAGVRGVTVLLPQGSPEAPDMEHAVREVVVEKAELAEAVRVRQEGDRLVLEAVRPRSRRLPRFDRSLSPLPLALAAAAAASKLSSSLALLSSYYTEEGAAAEFMVINA